MWSTAFFTAVVRYVVVGVVTGALAGTVLGLLLTGSGGSAGSWVGVVVVFSVVIGAALSLPVAVAGAATGLALAVRWPQRRGLVLVGLLWCPVLLVGALVPLGAYPEERGRPQQLVALLVVEALVIACVTVTHRWVTASLVSGVPRRS